MKWQVAVGEESSGRRRVEFLPPGKALHARFERAATALVEVVQRCCDGPGRPGEPGVRVVGPRAGVEPGSDPAGDGRTALGGGGGRPAAMAAAASPGR